jgi:glycosyltransferase involved in cell wall biosynthesis
VATKFLLISQVFYPDEVSTAGLFTDLCIELAGRGVEVEVWCAHPSYNSTRRQKKKKINYNGFVIKYLPSTNFKKDSVTGRIINIITFTVSVLVKFIFSGNKSQVFTHTTPPTLGILLSPLCYIKRQKFNFILLDIFPEGLIRLGKVSRKNLIIRFWQYCFLMSLKHCTKIIVIGRDMQTWVKSFCPDCSRKTEYIPLWQSDDIDFSRDRLNNQYLESNITNNKFIVQYSGNMGLWNDMAAIAKGVNNAPDDILFMFVGGGIGKNDLLTTLSSKKLEATLFLPFQPFERLGELLTSCHVALISLAGGLDGMAVPSKIYGILASGIPVIAMVPDNSEIAFIVKEVNCGYVVDPGDSDGMLNAVLALKNDENGRIKMGQNGQNTFLQKYTTKIIAGQYASLLLQH